MLNLSVRVPRPCLYMLGSPSTNLSIRVCNCLTPEICSWIQVHPLITWCLEATKHCWCILKEEHILSWYLNEGSSYYANKTPNKQYKMQQTSYVYKWNDMVLALDLHHVHRGMISIIPLCVRPRSMELTRYVCCKSIILYFYLQHHHIMTLA